MFTQNVTKGEALRSISLNNRVKLKTKFEFFKKKTYNLLKVK